MKSSLALLLVLVVLAAALAVLAPSERRSGSRSVDDEFTVRSNSGTEESASLADAVSLIAERELTAGSEARGAEGPSAGETAIAPVEKGTGSLWIQVESRETGEPLAGVRLRAFVDSIGEEQSIVHASYSRGTQLDSLLTDEVGMAVYHLSLTPGTHLLEAQAEDQRGAQRVTLDSPNGEVSGVVLRLEPGGTLVVDTGQIPTEEADRTRYESWYWTAHAGDQLVAEGRFRGPRSPENEVPAGELTLRLERYNTKESQSRVIRMRPGREVVATFAFE